jgi:hypothetical protein
LAAAAAGVNKMGGRLRIGITVGLSSAQENIWTNGVRQNALFLAEALRRCEMVADVTLLNTTQIPITPELPWDLRRWPTRRFDDGVDEVDVVIELGAQVGPEPTRRLHQRGAKLVSYCCGTEYVQAIEAMLFNRPLWGAGLFVNREYDAVWAIPQVADMSAAFFSTLRRRPVQVVPFVWDPVVLEQRSAALPAGGTYAPRAGPRRISVMEPNIDVVKFCLYPALIADEAYRRNPGSIRLLQVTNAHRIATESAEFIALMSHLDLVRGNRAAFLGMHATPDFLASNTDIVVSHQWDNPLNYFYLEVCWQGFPLVHNASLCPDIGYYYEGHDIHAGAERLLEAIQSHDHSWEAYRAHQRECIARFLPSHPDVTRTYSELLQSLMEGRP